MVRSSTLQQRLVNALTSEYMLYAAGSAADSVKRLPVRASQTSKKKALVTELRRINAQHRSLLSRVTRAAKVLQDLQVEPGLISDR